MVSWMNSWVPGEGRLAAIAPLPKELALSELALSELALGVMD